MIRFDFLISLRHAATGHMIFAVVSAKNALLIDFGEVKFCFRLKSCKVLENNYVVQCGASIYSMQQIAHTSFEHAVFKTAYSVGLVNRACKLLSWGIFGAIFLSRLSKTKRYNIYFFWIYVQTLVKRKLNGKSNLILADLFTGLKR